MIKNKTKAKSKATDNVTDLIDRLTRKNTPNKKRLDIAKEILIKHKLAIEVIEELRSMAQSDGKYRNVAACLYNELVFKMNGIDATEKC